jgi:plasmid stabilization system protein ParE
LFAVKYKGIRCAVIKKFPFSIFYLVEEEQQKVNIIAVLHNAQNPEIWEERAE